ncbi:MULTISPECIES: GNAT family N-acetyltransferase [unclassified Pseudomonas]|uniref:GNAT family N-acetyltransferase n=1 Tax=unclassified Pseudomonas TaxID=196821 RepID=UPI0008399ABF|nr:MULTISPECIES: GNAT family N-acetyltransferase [unclassified Pseudomonas]QIH11930.1 GNAT family N-acetyltransferase [Pseudomonas sp. BIOMIG1BAC]
MTGNTSRLVYRVPQPGDAQRLLCIYGDPRTQLFNPAGPMADLGEAERLLERWIEHWARYQYGTWAISSSDAPEQILGFGGIAHHHYLAEQRVNLGYRFAVEAWGKGYATQLGQDALQHAFVQLGLPEVFALVRPDHAASIRVLEKIGMQLFAQLDDVPGQAPSLVYRVRQGQSS